MIDQDLARYCMHAYNVYNCTLIKGNESLPIVTDGKVLEILGIETELSFVVGNKSVKNLMFSAQLLTQNTANPYQKNLEGTQYYSTYITYTLYVSV